MYGMRLRFVIASVLAPLLVLGTALAGGWWASGRVFDARSPLASAIDYLPVDTQIGGFTNWASIRQRLGVGAASTASARAALSDDAALRDLSTRSVIGRSIEEMHRAYGWSAANLDWEAYGQAADGAAMVAHLDRSVSLSTVRSGLRGLGYVRDGRVWTVGKGSVESLSAELIDTLGAVAVLPRQRLIVAADRGTYVSTVLKVIDREQPSLLSARAVADVVTALGGTDTALLQSRGIACEATSLIGEGNDVQAQGRAAVERTGELRGVVYAGRGLEDLSSTKQSIRFAFAFESPSDASQQLRVRTALASGPFIGRGGRIEDSLVLAGGQVNGSAATLRFDHGTDSASYMVGSGPILFASCPA